MDDFNSFIDYEKKRAAEAGLRVASNPAVFASIKRWKKMSPGERDDFLRLYTNNCSRELAGGPGMVIVTFFPKC